MFSDDYLLNSVSFGIAYKLARKCCHAFNSTAFDGISSALHQRRAALLSICQTLLEQNALPSNDSAVKQLKSSLERVNTLYYQYGITANTSVGILTATLYFDLKASDHRDAHAFLNWLKSNDLVSLSDVDGKSLIDIYNRILARKKRHIFLSMWFDPTMNEVRDAVKQVIDRLNLEHGNEFQFTVLRMDEYDPGHSYKISDAILQAINDCGLLLVDLTGANPNVYHELGFQMGVNEGRGLPQENFILMVKKDTQESKEPFIGFNLKSVCTIGGVRLTQPAQFGLDVCCLS